jgi:hypothetical protein
MKESKTYSYTSVTALQTALLGKKKLYHKRKAVEFDGMRFSCDGEMEDFLHLELTTECVIQSVTFKSKEELLTWVIAHPNVWLLEEASGKAVSYDDMETRMEDAFKIRAHGATARWQISFMEPYKYPLTLEIVD